MEVIRDLQSAGAAVFFTIDAGPQLKAVCEPGDTDKVRDALAAVPGVEDILVSDLGGGAVRIDDD